MKLRNDYSRPHHLSGRVTTRLGLLVAVAGVGLLLFACSATAETPGPGWAITSTTYPTDLKPAEKGVVLVQPLNIGAVSSSGEITVKDELPSGITATVAGSVNGPNGPVSRAVVEPEVVIDHNHWVCAISESGERSIVTCHNDLVNLPAITGGAGFPRNVEQNDQQSGFGHQPPIAIVVEVAPGAEEGLESKRDDDRRWRCHDCGRSLRPGSDQLHSVALLASLAWDGWFSNADGTQDTNAGSVPYAFTTSFDLATLLEEGERINYKRRGLEARNFEVKLPPGFLGDPQTTAQCTRAQFGTEACPPNQSSARSSRILRRGSILIASSLTWFLHRAARAVRFHL